MHTRKIFSKELDQVLIVCYHWLMARERKGPRNPKRPTPHEREGKVPPVDQETKDRIWKRLTDRNPELKDKDEE